MGYIPEGKILEIQRSVNIVDLISSYIPLKRTGANFKALCPFHDEKTPSFVVNPSKQIFRCFGCNTGGTIFHFVMKYENVEFPEAVKIVADKYGIKMAYSQGSFSEEDQQEKTALYKVNKWAAGYFHQSLLTANEKFPARAYLDRRGLSSASVARFLIGYIPDNAGEFINAAKLKDISLTELMAAGLVVKRQESGYDDYRMLLRGRVAFPIFDARDKVVGFGARVLDDAVPKYLNTAETPIFVKGRILYGLNFAKNAAIQSRTLMLVEGYTDVIMAHQFGFENTVATLGTALTREHIMQMRRYADTIIAVYDGDSAGKKASERSLDMFLNEDITLKIATLPEGYDPCDCLLKLGAKAFKESIDKSLDLFAYRLGMVKNKYDLSDISKKAQAIDELLDFTCQLPDESSNKIKKDLQLKQIAGEFGVDEKSLHARFMQKYAPQIYRKRAFAPKEAPAEPAPQVINPSLQLLAEEFICLLISDNSLIEEAVKIHDPGIIQHKVYNEIIDRIFDSFNTQRKVTLSQVLSTVTDDALTQRLVRVYDESADKGLDITKRFAQCKKDLEKLKLQNRLQELKLQRAQAEKTGQKDDNIRLLKEILECEKMLRTNPATK